MHKLLVEELIRVHMIFVATIKKQFEYYDYMVYLGDNKIRWIYLVNVVDTKNTPFNHITVGVFYLQ